MNANAICVQNFWCKIHYHVGTLLVEIILSGLAHTVYVRFHMSARLLLFDKCRSNFMTIKINYIYIYIYIYIFIYLFITVVCGSQQLAIYMSIC